MSWKNTLVTDRHSAYRLLVGEIERKSPCPLKFRENLENGLKLKGLDPSNTDYCPFKLRIVLKGDEVRLEDVFILDPLKGKKLFPVTIKAAAALAREIGVTSISICNIIDNGWLAWPYMGAEPLKHREKNYLPETLRHLMPFYKIPHDREKAYKLLCAKQIGAQAFWRRFAPMKFADEKDKTLRAKVIKGYCLDDTMRFNLADPWTYKLLTQRLGKLPDFGAGKKSKPARRIAPSAQAGAAAEVGLR